MNAVFSYYSRFLIKYLQPFLLQTSSCIYGSSVFFNFSHVERRIHYKMFSEVQVYNDNKIVTATRSLIPILIHGVRNPSTCKTTFIALSEVLSIRPLRHKEQKYC